MYKAAGEYGVGILEYGLSIPINAVRVDTDCSNSWLEGEKP